MSAPERTALYRVWGEADLLLYIGVSKDFGKRWKQHAMAQPWWDEMKRLTVDEWFASRPEAETAEKAAIKTEGPKYNIAHAVAPPPRRRKGDPRRREIPDFRSLPIPDYNSPTCMRDLSRVLAAMDRVAVPASKVIGQEWARPPGGGLWTVDSWHEYRLAALNAAEQSSAPAAGAA